MKAVDFLIVGQGLAGTCLAWELLGRGARVLIADPGEPMTASKISAGLLNPIIGRNYNVSWRFRECYAAAKRFYREREEELGVSFFRELPLVRMFREEHERKVFGKKRAKGLYEGLLSDPQPEPPVPEGMTNEFGGFQIARAGSVETSLFLEASRRRFAELGCLAEAEVKARDVDPGLARVEWRDVEACRLVMCVGHRGTTCPCFPWISYRPAKGEILDIEIEDFDEQRIFNKGNWLFPTPDGHWRTGTTYSWESLDTKPTAEARKVIEERLRALLPGIRFSVREHRAAVRPIVHGRKAVLGCHPSQPRLVVFNGLSSKGALQAPWCAAHLANHLLDGTPLDPEVDLAKRFPLE
jgi:glycine/D-amino acid oxidase-like deaminating enzyme